MWKVLFLAFVVSLPVAAEEKVWYCSMTGVVITTNEDGAELYKPEKFRMKVSPTAVVFGNDGFFKGTTLKISWWGDFAGWQATDEFGIAGFKDGNFQYAQAGFRSAVAISARCDDF